MLGEERPAKNGDGDEGAAFSMLLLDKAAVVGVFPNGKSRTGRAPCLDDFRIGPRLRANPLEQIEYQRLHGLIPHLDQTFFVSWCLGGQ